MNEETKNVLRVIPLGGVEEIGINCTLFEYNNRIVIVDLGLGFPDNDMYGIDYVVPNTGYLEKRTDDIEGIIITHGHLDHIGALPYLLPRLNFPPIYATQFTAELIKAKLEDFKLNEKVKINIINSKSVLSSGDFKIQFFDVNHSIPQCVGVVIETPTSKVVHTGDFKFDNSPVNEPVADYGKIARIGEMGIDLLLSDSTNSLKKGHPISESDVAERIEQIIKNAQSRVIIASFSGLVGRLYQIIKIAEKLGRKIAVAGYGMNQTLRIAQEIGYIKPGPGVIIPIQSINRFHPDKIIILTTGAQGEENAALYRMATEGYKNVFIKKGDTVLISAGTIPGNQTAIQMLTDVISEKGGTVYQSEQLDFFTSGHGYQEDQKIMLNLIKPKQFMPVHGYQYFLKEHGRTAVQVGIPEKNIIIAKRGSIIAGTTKTGFSQHGIVKSQPLLVSGLGVGDIGEAVLSERRQLGNYGVVTIMLNVDSEKFRLIGDPYIQSRGFVFVKNSADLFNEMRNRIHQFWLRTPRKEISAPADLREKLSQNLSKFLAQETGRDPVIMIMVNYVGRPMRQARPQPKHDPKDEVHLDKKVEKEIQEESLTEPLPISPAG